MQISIRLNCRHICVPTSMQPCEILFTLYMGNFYKKRPKKMHFFHFFFAERIETDEIKSTMAYRALRIANSDNLGYAVSVCSAR